MKGLPVAPNSPTFLPLFSSPSSIPPEGNLNSTEEFVEREANWVVSVVEFSTVKPLTIDESDNEDGNLLFGASLYL